MLTAARSLKLSSQSSPKLPEVPAFEALYRQGCTPRQGEVIMVAGRSGTGKSAFALYWVKEMNLPTLYFSADMSAYQASIRLACSVMQMSTEEVEARMAEGGRSAAAIEAALSKLDITFSFGEISWRGLDEEIQAYVELRNEYPKVIVIDNLMDVEGAESSYEVQMATMQSINDLSRETGATVIVLHHASDKSWDARNDPWMPPSRQEIKGGLSEKPALSLTVAFNPQTYDYRVAVVKQRMGRCDPTGKTFATLTADLATNTFHKWNGAGEAPTSAPYTTHETALPVLQRAS